MEDLRLALHYGFSIFDTPMNLMGFDITVGNIIIYIIMLGFLLILLGGMFK